MKTLPLILVLSVLYPVTESSAASLVGGRKSLVFENPTSRLIIDLAGGSLRELRFRDHIVNPLNWGQPGADNTRPKVMGHFLCLDRWGPPSQLEGEYGMPYHGEAGNVNWVVDEAPHDHGGVTHAVMSAQLPMAGLSVIREIQLSPSEPLVMIHETVTNENKLGRPYNMVQHPSIAPPFLTENTIVDANGRLGFAQGGSLPNPEEPSAYWPTAFNQEGERVNLRYLRDDHHPNVASFTIDEPIGWVTAATPEQGLLIGYLWPTTDYPWLDIWRNVREGQPNARGLEFGTTGLHQPFPILMEKSRIFGRKIFEYLDAAESATKRYAVFLLRIPSDFNGVETIKVDSEAVSIAERAGGKNRKWKIPLGGLELDLD